MLGAADAETGAPLEEIDLVRAHLVLLLEVPCQRPRSKIGYRCGFPRMHHHTRAADLGPGIKLVLHCLGQINLGTDIHVVPARSRASLCEAEACVPRRARNVHDYSGGSHHALDVLRRLQPHRSAEVRATTKLRLKEAELPTAAACYRPGAATPLAVHTPARQRAHDACGADNHYVRLLQLLEMGDGLLRRKGVRAVIFLLPHIFLYCGVQLTEDGVPVRPPDWVWRSSSGLVPVPHVVDPPLQGIEQQVLCMHEPAELG
mmetsp:Transcript_84668/g.262107  ORF Transcript_84668/g.262107 Transcript_84668/m.262107 type:complete len:260 (+) Transcript_84668:789-1568(+)